MLYFHQIWTFCDPPVLDIGVQTGRKDVQQHCVIWPDTGTAVKSIILGQLTGIEAIMRPSLINLDCIGLMPQNITASVAANRVGVSWLAFSRASAAKSAVVKLTSSTPLAVS